MPIKNADVTQIIEQMTDKFRNMLKTLDRQQPGGRIDPNRVIGQLLFKTSPYRSITINDINNNYRIITGNTDNLLPPMFKEEEANIVAKAAEIHLKAIADGFNAYVQKAEHEQAQARAEVRAEANAAARRPVHVHYHHGYYRDPWLDFYRDMWFYQLVFDNHHCHHHTPSTPSTGKSNNEDNVSWAGVLLAAALVAAAAASIGYTTMQTYYLVDEIIHGETMLANTVKLTATGLAAWQGYMVGSALGAAYFANPILGAVCSSIIAAGLAMKASKWGMELVNHQTHSKSAHDTDPRFCLSSSQRQSLINDSYNPDVISEALREIAIMMKKEPANGLKFWHNPHSDLIDLMRQLKHGYPYDQLVLNGKNFNLRAPENVAYVVPPPPQVVERESVDEIPQARAVPPPYVPTAAEDHATATQTAPLHPTLPVEPPKPGVGQYPWAYPVPPVYQAEVVQPTAPPAPVGY